MSDSDGADTRFFGFGGECTPGDCSVFEVDLYCPYCSFSTQILGLQPPLSLLKDFVSHVESHDAVQVAAAAPLHVREASGHGSPLGSGNPDGETSSAKTVEHA